MDSASVQLFGTVLSALVTVMVLSYLWRDNAAFRTATYLFVGVSAGYAGAIAWHTVLEPGLIDPLFQRGLGAILDMTLLVPWILIVLLLFKVSPATSRLGSLSTALMVGVGAAVVVGGAITGTLLPQTLAAMNTLNPAAITPTTGETGLERIINVVILLVGTISTLVYFRFTARQSPTGEAERNRLVLVTAQVGRLFIAITFAVMYAGVLMSSLIVLGDRLEELVDLVFALVGG
ncbi:MAG TPA: hypothetical protein VGA52_10315 [Anaerolineales bacterium]